MKCFFTAMTGLAFFVAGCTGQTPGEPQVISGPTGGTPTPPFVSTNTPSAPQTPLPMMTPASLPSASEGHTNKISYSSCYVDGPYIAMTFDDGPSAELTPKLLDILKQRNIKATFFLVGECVAQHPEIVKREVEEGHEVGNHSWNHPQLTKLGADGFRRQIEDTNDAILRACGVRPTVMRPPYGATNASLNKIINDNYGMKVILWSVDPLDWKYRNSKHVHDQILAQAHPGAIILSHDIHATTVEAMAETFDDLLAKGYKFVTVSELLAMDRPAPSPTPAPKKEAAPPKAASQNP